MKNSKPATYKIKETYREQLIAAVINYDAGRRSWAWKGSIDFEDGPYTDYTSRRDFTSGSEAEEHMRRFAHERIDNWLITIRPGNF